MKNQIDMQKLSRNSKETMKFLYSIASHVNSKRAVRSMIAVCIREFANSCIIDVVPDTVVYQDKFHRKHANLQRVEDHVIINHFPELIDSINELGQVSVKTGILVPGSYLYSFSSTQKQRRWHRVH